MSNISVILPTYNERDNIKKMVEVLEKNLPSVEIIIVDDDSPDKTWQVAEEMCSKYSNLKLIRRIKNKGGWLRQYVMGYVWQKAILLYG